MSLEFFLNDFDFLKKNLLYSNKYNEVNYIYKFV